MSTMPESESAASPEVSKVTEDSNIAIVPQNGREARNLAEKHRRDKLNASIQELSTMVPHVAESTRRLDKTAVLRFAAHGLRLRHVFGKSTTIKRQQLMPQLTDTLLQLLDSFFITLTCHGQIVVISSSVEKLLGHCQSDLYGQNILQLTHPEDQMLLRQQLIPQDMESLFHNEYQNDDHSECDDEDEEIEANYSDDEPLNCFDFCHRSSPHTQAHFDAIDNRLRTDRRCFTVRLARASTRTEAARIYEFVKFDGCFRRSDCSATAGSFPIVSQLIRRSRSNNNSNFGGMNVLQHDVITQAALHGVSGNDIVMVAMGRIIRPPKIVNCLLDANRLEYRTRHLIDGRIVDCDQRIGLVAGYMKEEVRNLSPFSFMHQDDVRWVIVALRQMYDCSSDYGESYFRLLSRNGNFIYLQTKGFLEVDKSTNKVHSFVCVNTLLDEEEGRRKVQEMKDKFSIIIKTKIPTNSLEDVPASQNPQQLERIVLYLIENLQKSNDTTVAVTTDDATTVSKIVKDEIINRVKTPPLALVPPEPASVKNSISESVNVVNVTAAKNLNSSVKSPYSQQNSESSLSPVSYQDDDIESITEINYSPILQRPSVLKMNTPPATPNIVIENKIFQTNSPNSSYNTISSSPILMSPTSIITVSPSSSSQSSVSPLPTTQTESEQPKPLAHVSVLKRLNSSPVSVISQECTRPAKQPTATVNLILSDKSAVTPVNKTKIHTVITTSLKNINSSLKTISQDTQSLCQQCTNLPSPVPRSIDQKLDAVLIETQKQKKILVNIRSEYEQHQHLKQQPTQKLTNKSIGTQPRIREVLIPKSTTVILQRRPL